MVHSSVLQVYSHGLVGEVGALITIKDSTIQVTRHFSPVPNNTKDVTVILALELAHVTFRIIFARGFLSA